MAGNEITDERQAKPVFYLLSDFGFAGKNTGRKAR
jgi:hypothetical protein